MPRFDDFMADARTAGVGLFPGSVSSWLEFDVRLSALARSWEASDWFFEAYSALDDAQYIARVYANAGVEASDAERSALVGALASRAETRAGVLLRVAVDPRVEEREHNRSLLLLRRPLP